MEYEESPRVARLHEALDHLDDAMVLLSLHEVGAYGVLVKGPQRQTYQGSKIRDCSLTKQKGLNFPFLLNLFIKNLNFQKRKNA